MSTPVDPVTERSTAEPEFQNRATARDASMMTVVMQKLRQKPLNVALKGSHVSITLRMQNSMGGMARDRYTAPSHAHE